MKNKKINKKNENKYPKILVDLATQKLVEILFSQIEFNKDKDLQKNKN